MNEQLVGEYINTLSIEVDSSPIDELTKIAAVQQNVYSNNVQHENGNNVDWNLTIVDQLRFSRIFRDLSADQTYITLTQIKDHYKLKDCDFIDIWCLCNGDYTNILSREQFTVFNWLLQEKQKGKTLPASLCDILKMPERYREAVKCAKLQDEKIQDEIDYAIQANFANQIIKHKRQCAKTKKILISLKDQTESMLKSLYQREICITSIQIENETEESTKLHHFKEEIISLQQECATNVNNLRVKLQKIEKVQNRVNLLIYEVQDFQHVDLDGDAKSIQYSSNPFANETTSTNDINPENILHNDEQPLLDSTDDLEE